MRIEFAAASHTGRRAHNEDAVLTAPDLGLFAVADGMGGYEGGEIASGIVVETLRGFYRRNLDDPEGTWPYALELERSFAENLLGVAIKSAHLAVCARKSGRLSRMGSTVAALAFDRQRVVLGHVGDSRIYRLRAGEIVQLTRDHSLYAELCAAGQTDIGSRSDFPYANVITRAVGMLGSADPELSLEITRPGDTWLLCTDGLFEGLPTERIAEVLDELAPAEASERLVHEAIAAGSRDNVSVVVLQVVA